MGFWKKLFKKDSKRYEFRDIDAQEANNMLRQKKAIIRGLQMDLEIEELQQQLSDLRGEYDDDNNNPDNLFMDLLSKASKVFVPQANAQAMPQNQQITRPNEINLTKEQIQQFYNSLPTSQKALMKFASDDDIREAIKQQIPMISTESLELCLEIAHKNR